MYSQSQSHILTVLCRSLPYKSLISLYNGLINSFSDNYQKVSILCVLTSHVNLNHLEIFQKAKLLGFGQPSEAASLPEGTGHLHLNSNWDTVRGFSALCSFIWTKACWPSRLSASLMHHPSKETFLFLFPVLPFSDELLLPCSLLPYTFSFSPKSLPLVLPRRHPPKTWTDGGKYLHMLYTYTICHLTCCIGYLYVRW